jgi:catechol 2,3-dioxygenase-like lactoylglutathione lyase family enzyme
MIDHISIAVCDLPRATAFYGAVLGPLGYAKLRSEPKTVGYGKRYPEFWLNVRSDMAPVAHDSGVHICLRARDRAAVEAFHAAALTAGGSSDGAPGARLEYSAGYYAAFIRDPDGNRIEAVTFIQPGEAATRPMER